MAMVDGWRDRIAGSVVAPDETGYDEARRVWNGMIDRRPSHIVRAAGVDDIRSTIARARELGLPLAVRGGGHNVAGNGTVDGGIVLDLGGLTAVEVDPERHEVRVDGGATLGHLDRATEPHGLAVPVGVVSGTGVGGLTLGGGVGWLTRAYGLSVDNLLAADVVTASGDLVHATATENADLLWGLRGGGGNFGVVTSFTFRAHPLGPDVQAGNFFYGADRWADALRAWDAWSREAPDAMTTIISFLVPPPEFELGDEPKMFIGWAWASPDRAAGERVADDLRRAAPPDEEAVHTGGWAAWQSQVDDVFAKGLRAYWKNTSFDRLDDATIEVITRRGAEQTWRGTGFDLHHMEGAFGRVPADATPFPGRSARFWLNVYGFWPEASDDAARTAFVRGFAADMAPHASGAQYVNFLGREGDGGDAVEAARTVYGPAAFERLVALKRRYDPDNLFRLNHNIPPG